MTYRSVRSEQQTNQTRSRSMQQRARVKRLAGGLLAFSGCTVAVGGIAADWLGIGGLGSGFGIKQYLTAACGLTMIIAGVLVWRSGRRPVQVSSAWRSFGILLACVNLLFGSLLVLYPQDVAQPLSQVHALFDPAVGSKEPLLDELLTFFEARARAAWAANQAAFNLDGPQSAAEAQALISAIGSAVRASGDGGDMARMRSVSNVVERPLGTTSISRRYQVRFQNDLGLTIDGILSVPLAEGRHPLIIIPNGMSSTPEHLFLIAEEDYQHGCACQFEGSYVVFAVHLPSVEDFDYELRLHNRMNWAAEAAGMNYRHYLTADKVLSALDYLETRPEVDRSRVAVYGISMGGNASIDAGAVDQRVTVIAGSGTNVFTPAYQQLFERETYKYPYYYQYDQLSRPDAGTTLVAAFPTKVIVELNRQDTTGDFDAALQRAQQIKRIYALLGRGEDAVIITFDHARSEVAPNGHEMQVTAVKNQIDRWFGIQSSPVTGCTSRLLEQFQ